MADIAMGFWRKFFLTSVVAGLLFLAFAGEQRAQPEGGGRSNNRCLRPKPHHTVSMWQTPVLLHVFADAGCACGDYRADVTGLVVPNPFRDRSPEDKAARFLDDLGSGQCTVDDAVCGYALESHRVSHWQLMNRHDRGEHVELYYKLTKYGVTEPEHRLTGEGVVELARTGSGWSVVGYSAYF